MSGPEGEDVSPEYVADILRRAEQHRKLLAEGDLDNPDTIEALRIEDAVSRAADLYRPEGYVPEYADDDPDFGKNEEE